MSATDAEAEAIYDKLGRGAQSDVKTIAAAIIVAEKRGREEERERCAKIADEIEEREERIWIEDDSESGRAADAAEEIAAAIRGS